MIWGLGLEELCLLRALLLYTFPMGSYTDTDTPNPKNRCGYFVGTPIVS